MFLQVVLVVDGRKCCDPKQSHVFFVVVVGHGLADKLHDTVVGAACDYTGVGGLGYFDEAILEAVLDSIRQRELVIAADHANYELGLFHGPHMLQILLQIGYVVIFVHNGIFGFLIVGAEYNAAVLYGHQMLVKIDWHDSTRQPRLTHKINSRIQLISDMAVSTQLSNSNPANRLNKIIFLNQNILSDYFCLVVSGFFFFNFSYNI